RIFVVVRVRHLVDRLDQRQRAVRVTDPKQPSHGLVRDYAPAQVRTRAFDVDQVQRRKARGAKELQVAQIQDQWRRVRDATVKIVGERSGVGCVEFSVDGDDHAGRIPLRGESRGMVLPRGWWQRDVGSMNLRSGLQMYSRHQVTPSVTSNLWITSSGSGAAREEKLKDPASPCVN